MRVATGTAVCAAQGAMMWGTGVCGAVRGDAGGGQDWAIFPTTVGHIFAAWPSSDGMRVRIVCAIRARLGRAVCVFGSCGGVDDVFNGRRCAGINKLFFFFCLLMMLLSTGSAHTSHVTLSCRHNDWETVL